MRRRFLVCGAAPGVAAGNATSTQVLCDVLDTFGTVDVLTHTIRSFPSWQAAQKAGHRTITIGVQPALVHGESLIPGRLYRDRLRAAQYDIIWAVNSRYAGVARGANLPYLVWEATPIRDELATMSIREVRQAGRGSGLGLAAHRATLHWGEYLERRMLARAVKVYAMSEYTRCRILEIHGLPSSQVELLLHPPSRAFLDALKRRGGVAGRITRVDGATPRLLFVGRADDPRKNLALLFDACRQLDAEGFPVAVTVVGPHNNRWAQSQLPPPNVQLLGGVDIDRLIALYLSHDVLVLTSRQEGFGIVVAEAMHAGLPVVTTPCGGPEDVLRRSEAGLIAGFAVHDLARAIRDLVANQDAWRSASRNGVRFAATELSLDRMMDNVRRILTQALGAVDQPRPFHAAQEGPDSEAP